MRQIGKGDGGGMGKPNQMEVLLENKIMGIFGP